MKSGDKVQQRKNTLEILFFLIGLTSTWAAVQVPFFGTQIAIYNIVIIITVLYYFLKYRITKIYLNEKYMTLFILETIFSTLLGTYWLSDIWISESVKATLKFVIVFLPFVLFFKKEDIQKHSKFFFEGLYFSCIVQLVWSTLQLIFWYGFNRVLNQEFFGNLLHIQTNHSWLTWHQGFRTTGISWESANLGMCLIFGFYMTKKPLMKALFFLGIIFSGSRTSMMAMVLSYCFLVLYRKYKGENKKIKKKTFVKIFSVLISIAVVFVVLFQVEAIKTIFLNTLKSFQSRIVSAFQGSDISAGRHIDYYLKMGEVWNKSNLLQIIFGYGTSCSGYPFTDIYANVQGNAYAWNIESDVLGILVGNGIVGFVLYYACLGKAIHRQMKLSADNYNGLAAMVSILLAGIMYVYARSWVTLVMIFIACGAQFIIQDNRSEKVRNQIL